MITKRSLQKEFIDLGPSYYTPEEYRDCLYQLDRIGRFLGGDRATFRAFDRLKSRPASILDIGCGGGLFTMRLAQRYLQTKVIGVDLSSEAIALAQEHLERSSPPLSNLSFLHSAAAELPYSPQQFDVVTSTLVCHHLSDEELISFLKQARHLAKQAVILNDLHRHPFATAGFSVLVPLFFRNRLIWHDGLLSIQRAFKKRDWQMLLKEAGIKEQEYRIDWVFPFRWVVMINGSR